MKNKKYFTFEEKVKWLTEYLGHEPQKTILHTDEGVGSFEYEVNQDFNALYPPLGSELGDNDSHGDVNEY
jgi:hypothetical protein